MYAVRVSVAFCRSDTPARSAEPAGSAALEVFPRVRRSGTNYYTPYSLSRVTAPACTRGASTTTAANRATAAA